MPKILIIGEVISEEEQRTGQRFASGTGFLLKKLLQQAGIPEEECLFSHVITDRSMGGSFESYCTSDPTSASSLVQQYNRSPKLFFDKQHDRFIHSLRQLVAEMRPSLILALGDAPFWLLTGKRGISKNRGAPMLAGDVKLIATYSLHALIKNWSLRPVILQDFCKAKRQAADPRLVRPRRILHLNPSLEDIEAFYHEHIIPAPFLSVDVETKLGQITEVGIATSRSRALVIPFWCRAQPDGNYWRSLQQEVRAWAWVRRFLTEKPSIGQNFQYDIQYFYRTLGIPVPRFIGDTMLLHHAMQPELEKGLGFLGSIYTDEPAWKFMRTDAATLKKEN